MSGMCFHKKKRTHLCILMKRLKIRRERDGVTTSQTNCICKRVCVKNVFFVFPKNCEALFQNLPKQKTKNVVEYTRMKNMHVPARTTAKGTVVMFLP